MCGRFTLTGELAEFAKTFGIALDPNGHNRGPRYNICPSQDVPVVFNDSRKAISHAMWGLIPSWAKDPNIGNRLANARAEGIESKPSFRVPFKKQRCLVLADGFYEWQPPRPGSKDKIPYHFRMKDKSVFAFAGLWDTWHTPIANEPVTTCCLITTTPNHVVEPVHDRMPVILEPKFYDLWLSPDEKPADWLKQCLKPYSEEMEGFPVTRFVNKPQNDTPECIRPAD